MYLKTNKKTKQVRKINEHQTLSKMKVISLITKIFLKDKNNY